MDDLVAACVLHVGDRSWHNRPRYDGEWVRRLRNMVQRNLSMPHRFVCLSNIDIPGVDRIPLRHNWPGWWSKIELFSPVLQAKRIISFDLDVLITGSLDELVSHPAPLIFMPPHSQIVGRGMSRRSDVREQYQSSCMVWSPPAGREIYDKFTPVMMRRWLGDQDWMASLNPSWPTFDPKWFRKIRQCLSGPPAGVKIILSMPVKNDEAANLYPWVRAIWQ